MSVSPSVAVSRVIFAAGLALAPIIAGGEAAAQSKLEASYTISFARIPVGSITATSEIDNAEYTTAMSGKASAILRVLAGGEGTLAASGRGPSGQGGGPRRAGSARGAINQSRPPTMIPST